MFSDTLISTYLWIPCLWIHLLTEIYLKPPGQYNAFSVNCRDARSSESSQSAACTSPAEVPPGHTLPSGSVPTVNKCLIQGLWSATSFFAFLCFFCWGEGVVSLFKMTPFLVLQFWLGFLSIIRLWCMPWRKQVC